MKLKHYQRLSYTERGQTKGLDRYEYRYLTFLISKYGLKSTASLPCLPKIIDVTLKEFEQRFSSNSDRKIIFKVFKKGIRRCLELYKLDVVEILVGGSYTNEENQSPNDIDPWQKHLKPLPAIGSICSKPTTPL